MVAVILVSGGNTLLAVDYTVTFKKTVTNSLIVTIGNDAYKTMRPWKSYYQPVFSSSGELLREGSLMTNTSSRTIVSFHIHNRGGKLTVPADAHGGRFKQILLKVDMTEVIFNGGEIKNTGPSRNIWMKVTPKSPNSEKALYGEHSDAYITPENMKEWTVIYQADDNTSKDWADVTTALPEGGREIRLYQEPARGGPRLLITSSDEYFWYDPANRKLNYVEIPSLPVGANRISVDRRNDQDCFVVWRNGIELHSISIKKPTLGIEVGTKSSQDQ